MFLISDKSNAASKSGTNKTSDKDKNFLAAPKGPSAVPPSPRRVKKEPMKKENAPKPASQSVSKAKIRLVKCIISRFIN